MNKQLLRDFITTRLALQELLKEALNIERNNQYQPLQNISNGKDHQYNEETAPTNRQNNQLASQWWIKFTHNNINPKCKWTKCTNQKTQTGKLDKKPKPISVLYPENPFHMQGCTKTQNKEMEEDLPNK